MTEKQRELRLNIRLYSLAMARFFPVQLLLHHLKRSWLFLAFWILLFGMTGNVFFRSLGIPYLFLTPEYLEAVSPVSYLIVGVALGLFTMSFHITSYIFYSHKYPFLATLSRPLYRFSFNNSVIPIAFYTFYGYAVISELRAEGYDWFFTFSCISSAYAGSILSLSLAFSWFFSTIRPKVFEKLGDTLDKTLRVLIVQEKTPNNLDLEGRHKVVTYLKNFHSVRWARDSSHYTHSDLLLTLQQHHVSAALFFLLLGGVVLSMGFFSDSPLLMIPAGASIVLLMTLWLMIVGALYSRFKGWTFALILLLILAFNYASRFPQFQNMHYVVGLDYDSEPAAYTFDRLAELTSDEILDQDHNQGVELLQRWKQKFPLETKPPLVIVNSSGGGLRSSLWTMAILQQLDSLSSGQLWKHTFMITGSSGGMVGAAYFRELKYRQGRVPALSPTSAAAYESLGKDLLNPMGFSLVANDLLFSWKKFEYDGKRYPYDRGWAFDKQLRVNTGEVFPQKWSAYADAELSAEMPWMILAPTIINEGRRLLISNVGASYLTNNRNPWKSEPALEWDGVEFYRLFEEQSGDSLPVTTALRMSANFPYITPLPSLPSDPRMEIIDAGARDNNGFELSLRFVYAFREWIKTHTGGVIFVQIMANQPPSEEIAGSPYRTRFDALIKPIGGVVSSFAHLQGYSAMEHLNLGKSWMEFPVGIHTFQLLSDDEEEIALSWHLTEREKRYIHENALSEENREIQREILESLHR